MPRMGAQIGLLDLVNLEYLIGASLFQGPALVSTGWQVEQV